METAGKKAYNLYGDFFGLLHEYGLLVHILSIQGRYLILRIH